jgi:hypothetical protein
MLSDLLEECWASYQALLVLLAVILWMYGLSQSL